MLTSAHFLFKPEYTENHFELIIYQGRHGRQGRQGLVLAYILRIRKRRGQQRYTSEVAATMAALPAKNLPWRPCHTIRKYKKMGVQNTFQILVLNDANMMGEH